MSEYVCDCGATRVVTRPPATYPYSEDSADVQCNACGTYVKDYPEAGEPECADECRRVLEAQYAKFHIDAHVTHIPQLVDSGYPPINLRCPHGVLWYAEPTSEQIAAWAAEGAE